MHSFCGGPAYDHQTRQASFGSIAGCNDERSRHFFSVVPVQNERRNGLKNNLIVLTFHATPDLPHRFRDAVSFEAIFFTPRKKDAIAL